jgi:hypothetical protein
MDRCLVAIAFGLTIVGCAVGIEDPQPPPTPEPEQQQPPAQTLSGSLVDRPYHGVAQGGLDDHIRNLPPKEKPPVPGLNSAPNAEEADGAHGAHGAHGAGRAD